MKNSQLNKVLRLVRRTGDRVVIMDNESDSAMVLMDIDAYEKMLGTQSDALENLSEEEMLEKINRDIARWRSYNDDEGADAVETDFSAMEEPEASVTRVAPAETGALSDNFEPIDITGGESGGPEALPVIPEAEANFGQDIGKVDLEEPLGDLPEEEEEKFYLEPVE